MRSRIRLAAIAGLVCLVLATAGCTGVTELLSPSSVTPAVVAPVVRVVDVQAGGLSGAITYSGNVLAKRQVGLVPKVSGRVTALNVDVGSAVKTGDVLLELDKDATTAQVAQATAALAVAQAKLIAIQNGPRPEQVAQAEANLDATKQRLALLQKGGRSEVVDQAQANLDGAKSRLAQVKKGPTSYDREQAKLAVDRANVAVSLAKNTLSTAKITRDDVCARVNIPPTSPLVPMITQVDCDKANNAVSAAKLGVDQSQKALDQAKTAYSQVKAGATSEQISQADAAVHAAEAALDLAKHPANPEDIAQAEDAVNVAAAALAIAKQPTTQQDQDAAQAAVAQAQAALEMAKIQLAETTIKAPFDGVISQRLVAVGAMAGPTSPLLTLISRETEIAVSVDEGDVAAIESGANAVVTVSAYPGQQFKAAVTSIAPAVDSKSRTAQVRLAPSDGSALRDGMSAQVQLQVGAGRPSALLVPRSAVVQEGQDSIVYVVGDGKVQRRVVTVGQTSDDRVEIVTGLSAGERVAVSGLSGLSDGQAVIVQ